jgi:hypothetical protein
MTRPQGRLKEQVQETVREIPAQAARLALFGVGRTLLLTDRVRKDLREARESGMRPILERWRGDAGQFAGKVMGRVGTRLPRTGRGTSAPAPGAREPEPPVATPPEGPARTADAALGAEPVAGPASATGPAPAAGSPTEPVAEPAPAPEPAPAAAPAAKAKPTKPTKPTKEAKAGAKAPAKAAKAGPAKKTARAAKVSAASLPVPDYDDATLASVRARLRTLTAAQVSQLRDYEAEHAARPDFLKMYENRIAKLTSGS